MLPKMVGVQDMAKYEFQLNSVTSVIIEAPSNGEAQQKLFRALDEGDYDCELRGKCTVDEGFPVTEEEKKAGGGEK